MSSDIDWKHAFINSQIVNYLSKYDVLTLSLANKWIRAKLYSNIYNDIKFNRTVLMKHSKDNLEKYYDFMYPSYIEWFKLLSKYGFDRGLAFKEALLDPFIEKQINTLNLASKHCKSITFEHLERSAYFIVPIFENFENLKKLKINFCVIPFIKFSDLLTKLKNLEVLGMFFVNLILSKSEEPNLANNLQFPKSLKELSYISVQFGVTDLPQTRPLDFARGLWTTPYNKETLYLKPQQLPKLELLKFRGSSSDVEKMREFFDLNPNMEHINDYDDWDN